MIFLLPNSLPKRRPTSSFAGMMAPYRAQGELLRMHLPVTSVNRESQRRANIVVGTRMPYYPQTAPGRRGHCTTTRYDGVPRDPLNDRDVCRALTHLGFFVRVDERGWVGEQRPSRTGELSADRDPGRGGGLPGGCRSLRARLSRWSRWRVSRKRVIMVRTRPVVLVVEDDRAICELMQE